MTDVLEIILFILMCVAGGLVVAGIVVFLVDPIDAIHEVKKIKDKVAKKARRDAPGEKYGHPWSPTGELLRLLPQAPDPYVWELKTETVAGQRNDYYMTLSLFDVTADKAVATKSVNLTTFEVHNSRWVDRYTSDASYNRDRFDYHLLGPVVEWATRVAKNHAPVKEFSLEYHLDQGSKK